MYQAARDWAAKCARRPRSRPPGGGWGGPARAPAGGAMVAEAELEDRLGAEALQPRLDLVQAVPAHPRLQGHDRVQALPSVGTRGAARMRRRDLLSHPLAVLELVAGAAGDAEVGVLGELRG